MQFMTIADEVAQTQTLHLKETRNLRFGNCFLEHEYSRGKRNENRIKILLILTWDPIRPSKSLDPLLLRTCRAPAITDRMPVRPPDWKKRSTFQESEWHAPKIHCLVHFATIRSSKQRFGFKVHSFTYARARAQVPDGDPETRPNKDEHLGRKLQKIKEWERRDRKKQRRVITPWSSSLFHRSALDWFTARETVHYPSTRTKRENERGEEEEAKTG